MTASKTSSQQSKTLLMLFLLLFSLPTISSLSFTQNPSINGGASVFTEDNIVCSWQYSGDTTSQNISIYRDGSLLLTRNETGTLNTSITILSGNSTKNEDWMCVVALDNGTSTTNQSVSFSIQNSAPNTPAIYNLSGQSVGTSYNLTEDTVYTFDVNSSDDDDDTLTYYFKAATQEFCTMTNSVTGIASCSPTQSDHDGSPTEVNVTFWVDDDDESFAKSASTKVTFTVIPYNDAPVLNLTNQSTPVNQTLTYSITATDEESNTPFNYTLVDVPLELQSKLSIVAVDNDTAQIIYNASTPDYNDVNESWIITVNVSDSLNASSTTNFYLNISSVGRTPEFVNFTPNTNASGFHSVNQGDFLQINFTATDADANDVHTFLASPSINGLSITTLQPNINVSNTTAQLNFTPGDDAVGIQTITITVRDQEQLTATLQINISVNNTNDAPVAYNESYSASNTNGNTNITNVTAYADAPFIFVVNATDPDLDSGDNITFTDNTTLFDINSSTGIISFTPQQANVSPDSYSILIFINDSYGLNVSLIMNLTIRNNTAPYFTGLPNISCAEGTPCTLNLSDYAVDEDGDDLENFTISFVGSNISSFAYNQTSGLINFTPSQSEIGNYTINITLADDKGASSTVQRTIQINNTAEAPDLTRYNFSQSLIVATHTFTYQLQATDNDLLITNTTENLTFTTNLTFINITDYIVSSDTTYATLSITPNSSQVGTHSINISVNDTSGLIDYEIITIEIFADTNPPQILQVSPYGNTSNSNAPVEELINLTVLGANSTALSFSENNTYSFVHITNDDEASDSQLNITWLYDGEVVATTWNYTRTFNFTSSGSHTLKLTVNDTRLEQSNFTWNLTIANVNRAPEFLNSLTTPFSINSTFIFPNYLSRYNDTTRFIDPDDDLNDDDIISGNETNNLVYTASSCTSGSTTIATVSISGSSVTFAPENQGSCSVIFTATDGSGASIQSNSVVINVTEQPEGEEETTTTSTSSGGGGGSSSSRTSFVPITQETAVPEPLNIIAPQMVALYQNTSVIIPFEVVNTWDEPLETIQLSATTNSTQVTAQLSADIIEELEPNETVELSLLLSNYRLGSNFEVEIAANVSDPEFVDTALVLLTSIEQASAGDQVEVKVTFARDLLNEHPECQELNELLDKANEELVKNNYAEARKYVDTAINGCKYLVGTTTLNTERPSSLPKVLSFDELAVTTIIYVLLAIVAILTAGFIIYYHYTSTLEDDI